MIRPRGTDRRLQWAIRMAALSQYSTKIFYTFHHRLFGDGIDSELSGASYPLSIDNLSTGNEQLITDR